MRRIRVSTTSSRDVAYVARLARGDHFHYAAALWNPALFAEGFDWVDRGGSPHSNQRYSADANGATLVMLTNGQVGIIQRLAEAPAALARLGLREVT